jgi:hypothetical protein
MMKYLLLSMNVIIFFPSISNKVSLFCTLYNKKFTLVVTILILMSKYTNLPLKLYDCINLVPCIINSLK